MQPPITAANGTGLEPNLAAALACFIPIVGGLLFLALEKQDRYVRFHAMQSLLLGVIFIAIWIGVQVLALAFTLIPILGWLIGILIWVFGIVIGLGYGLLWIVTVIQAFSGKEWEVPLVGPMARKQLGTMNPPPSV